MQGALTDWCRKRLWRSSVHPCWQCRCPRSPHICSLQSTVPGETHLVLHLGWGRYLQQSRKPHPHHSGGWEDAEVAHSHLYPKPFSHPRSRVQSWMFTSSLGKRWKPSSPAQPKWQELKKYFQRGKCGLAQLTLLLHILAGAWKLGCPGVGTGGRKWVCVVGITCSGIILEDFLERSWKLVRM